MLHRCHTLHSRLHQDGCEFEEATLGRCSAPCCEYVSWSCAAEQVRKHQPARKTDTVKALESEFERRLGIPVRFYTAVGSAMDVYHGTDGFLEYKGFIVTLDVTMDPNKACGKADMVVHTDDLANLSALAGRIACALLSKFERHSRY